MYTAEEISQLRTKLISHLERAVDLTERTGDTAAEYLLKIALEKIRAAESFAKAHGR